MTNPTHCDQEMRLMKDFFTKRPLFWRCEVCLAHMPNKKCAECDNIVNIVRGEDLGSGLKMSLDEAPRLCKSCMLKGWISDPREVAEAIANDPELSHGVGIVSPIQPEAH